MPETYEGPLQIFLTQYLQGKDIESVDLDQVTISASIRENLKVGNLDENFKIEGIHGSEEAVLKIVNRLMDKLYTTIGLQREDREVFDACCYTPNGRGSGNGAFVTITASTDSGLLRITVKDFDL